MRITVMTVVLFVGMIHAQAPYSRAMEIFVSPNGTATGPGTETKPLSLDAGMARISTLLKTEGLPEAGCTVTLKGGHYSFSEPLVLGQEFKGTAEKPIVIRARPGETVVLDGGASIEPDDFVDYDRLDLRFREASRFPKIPFERIGLYLDCYRSTMPSKSHYRSAVNRFFEGIGSMPGTTRQIDTADVVERGPKVTR